MGSGAAAGSTPASTSESVDWKSPSVPRRVSISLHLSSSCRVSCSIHDTWSCVTVRRRSMSVSVRMSMSGGHHDHPVGASLVGPAEGGESGTRPTSPQPSTKSASSVAVSGSASPSPRHSAAKRPRSSRLA